LITCPLIDAPTQKRDFLSPSYYLKRFTILPEKLLEEDGEVTPTMKIKRKFINETYKELIEKMYK
jgi:long-chain acyl-CoA synthetase